MKLTVAVGIFVTGSLLALGAAPVTNASTPNTYIAPSGTITISAASSLTDALPVIAAAFTKRFPKVTVKFNFAGSSTLVEQLNAGAPVDVIATASEPTMAKAVAAGTAVNPILFAKNTMAIAMPAGNPANITKLTDLTRPGVLVAVCDISIPCGTAARDLFKIANITVTPVTRELDVRMVLSKVIADEVDAGIVYVTDIQWAGSKVTSATIPSALNVVTSYPVAAVKASANPTAAKAFADYLHYSFSAQWILQAYGFMRP
jgi:molybdate transport system substrate-binding protein